MIDKLKQNNKIIINSDIDGVISGLLLSNFCNCTVVGFSNSADKVWIDTSLCKSIYDGVYIDMYVANPNIISIDQHIVAIDKNHSDRIKKSGNKVNPNIDNQRFLVPTSSYYRKYPFGTCHYIISLLCKEEIDLSRIDIHKTGRGIKLIDILLRADDAMNTTLCKYEENAKEWWNWLFERSNKSSFYRKIIEYLYSVKVGNVTNIKTEISKILLDQFKCDREDGGINQIMDEFGFVKRSAKEYIGFLSELSGLKCFGLDINLTEHKGQTLRIALTDKQKNELIYRNQIDGKDVFSYAFIHTINRSDYFSYTVDLNNLEPIGI